MAARTIGGAWAESRPLPGPLTARQVVIYGGMERRRPRRGRRCLLILAVLAGVLILSARQLGGSGGAGLADVLRSTIGPSATARLEAAYLDLLDTVNSVQYRLGAGHASAPWAITPVAATATVVPANAGALSAPSPPAASGPSVVPSARHADAPGVPAVVPSSHARPRPTAPAVVQATARLPLSPAPLATVITPAMAGEGQWTAEGLPPATAGHLVPVLKAFLRPDAARPYALVTMLQFDLRAARLHIVAGINEPGGTVGFSGSGLIPAPAVEGARLLSVFNGGFKYADGAYGLKTGGITYVQPVWGAATIAVTKAGNVIMGAWGLDRRLAGTNRSLVAWRQNAGLLIDHGRIGANTQVGAAWGLSILNSTYTWRSGIGVTRQGSLLYAAGNSLSAATLARSLAAAGAVTAMQLDINPFWVRSFTYSRDSGGRLVATALSPSMPGTGMEYLYGDVRDFFYLTRA